MHKNAILPVSLLVVILGFFVILSVSYTEDKPSVNTTQETASLKKSAASQKSAVPTTNTGVVKTIRSAGGYSYIEVDIDGQIFWMAASINSVQPGEKITWGSHAMMTNFTSKAFNQTFSQIMFVDKVVLVSEMVANSHSGTVIEIMNSASYSYIQVDAQGKKIWLAVPTAKINVGQNISWDSTEPMQNFSSRSLNRTFEEIFFVRDVQVDNS